MAIQLQIIRASEFIRMDAHKHLDLRASKEALRALAETCRKRAIDRVMIDLRTLPVLARPHFTTAELTALVSTFREAGFTREQRLAVLYQHDPHGGIRSFAFISRMRGLQVEAFNEFESALYWLAETPAKISVRVSTGVAIPIGTRASDGKKRPASLPVQNHHRRTVPSARRSHR
jgi:hypothetical protein